MTFPAKKKEKRKIKCRSYAPISSENGRIWPCCHVCTTNPKFSEYLNHLEKTDPNWNNISYKSLKEILEHDAYKIHFNKSHFEDHEQVDIICYISCGHSILEKHVKKI